MFKIHYILKAPQDIVPWGDEEHKSLQWFGLTDALLWITVGDCVIYEYSEVVLAEFKDCEKYNNYQLARFLEDFSRILPYVTQPIPKFLYDSVEKFAKNIHKWDMLYSEKSDEEYFDVFLDSLFEPIYQWFANRTFDSGHLIGGPTVGCFRFEDKVKIYWESEYQREDGSSMWKFPNGVYEIPYDEFVSEVNSFFCNFMKEMDTQVAMVLRDGIDGVSVDMNALARENELRKDEFTQKLETMQDEEMRLKFYNEQIDWAKVKELYDKMMLEI